MKGNDTGAEQNWINPQNMPLLRVESTQSTTILYIYLNFFKYRKRYTHIFLEFKVRNIIYDFASQSPCCSGKREVVDSKIEMSYIRALSSNDKKTETVIQSKQVRAL